MNEKSIQAILLKELYPTRAKILNTNYWLGYGEADVIAINPSDFVVEYEIKCSRSDFKADRKKVRKHKTYLGTHSYNKRIFKGVPNRFYYVCPKGLLKAEDMFAYSGLIYVDDRGNLETIVKAPLIHSNKATPSLIESIAHSLTIKLVYKMSSPNEGSTDSGLKADYDIDKVIDGLSGLPNNLIIDPVNYTFETKNEAKEFFKNL